jgi:nitroreductase
MPVPRGLLVPTDSTTHPIDGSAVTRALYKAAAAAGHAPSIHNTQPWRWRLSGDTMDLFAERSRMLDVTDPDGRLAILSCGTALHHARLALAAHGWRAAVTRLPDSADPDHLARLSVEGPAPIGADTERRAQNIRLRHTERGPATGDPIGPDELHAITEAVESQSIQVHVVHSDQVLDLAAATSHAQATEAAEAEWRAELARWAGGVRDSGTGVPDAVIPQAPPATTVPGRDFGHPGELPVAEGHDRPAIFAVLYGSGDDPIDWLRAGEALSALWLVATEMGVSVLPLSAAMEVVAARETVRSLLAGLGYPYLVLRLAHQAAADPGTAQTPRLPVDQIIEHTHG